MTREEVCLAMHILSRVFSVTTALFAGSVIAFAQAPQYTIQDLGALSSTGCQDPLGCFGISAINIAGQVVGFSTLNGQVHAFRTQPNSPINWSSDDLGSLGGYPVHAWGINSSGQVAGDSQNASSETHGFRTGPNATINPSTDDIGTLGGAFTQAKAINDSGQVTGGSGNGTTSLQAFRTGPNAPINPATDNIESLDFNCPAAGTNNGCFQTGPAPHFTSVGTRINAAGFVSGTWRGPQTAYDSSFLFSGTAVTVLPFIVAEPEGADFAGVNDRGQVPGNDPATFRDLSVWQDGSESTLAAGCNCFPRTPNGANNSLQVVGELNIAPHFDPFLLTNGAVYDLNSLIPSGSGWTLSSTPVINDNGQIAGVGTLNGALHAYRMDPVLTPAEAISRMRDLISSFNLDEGETHDLDASLDAALHSIDRGDKHSAHGQLMGLNHKVAAQSGSSLTAAQANQILAGVNALLQSL